ACARFHSLKAVRDATGAELSNDASHALKSRFIPYFNTTEQPLSRPFAFSLPLQIDHWRKLFAASGSRTLGRSDGSTTVAPCFLRIAIASSISAARSAFTP